VAVDVDVDVDGAITVGHDHENDHVHDHHRSLRLDARHDHGKARPLAPLVAGLWVEAIASIIPRV
jgi:hypothetical protein